ncbi:MAG: heparinase II/III domain-containing protein [Planctomycetota bacterium]|jgi:heparin/heparan-sulfate lyase
MKTETNCFICRAGKAGLLILLFSMLTAGAGGYDYDSRLVYDLCAPDQIVSSEGGSAEWGYYQQYQTHNGRLTGPGRFVAAQWNTCLAKPDYTYVLWSGAGEASFWLRGADDDGNASNNPGRWGEWVRLSGEGERLEIPEALDGKQFIQCRFELGEGSQLSQLEIHKKMRMPEHPRIYLTSEHVEEIKKRFAAEPEIKKLYEHYLNYMLKSCRGGGTRERVNAWATGWWMTSVGVAWNLSGDPVLLEEARAQLARLESPWAKGLGHFEHPQALGGAASLIDLVWNGLRRDEQERFGRALLEMADKQQKAWRFSDVSNQIYVNSGKNVLTGLALAGAGIDPEKESFYLRQAEDFMRLHLVPGSNFWASDDGGWVEGHGYCSFTMKDWAQEAHSWATASGEDVFQVANFFRFLSQWRVYERRYDGSMAKFNDSGRGGMGVAYASYIASRWGDRHAQKQAKAEIEQALSRPDDYSNTHLWQAVLWYEPKVPAEEDYIYPERMPLGRHFAGIGHVVAKSGWKADDLWAVFNSGRAFTPGTHYHADENSFIIDRGGTLALDSGSDDRSCDHYPGYFQRSIAHNTITVKKPGEKFRGPGNDGGQIGGSWMERYGGRFDAAQYGLHLPPQKLALRGIVAFETNAHYTYAVGDAAMAYDEGKVPEFTRQFLHLQPDTIIIFDRVTAGKPDYEKRWLLHTVEEPKVSGETAVVTHLKGRLFSKTLLPADARVEVIGGPGKEFWSDGQNFPIANKRRECEPGAWRVEVYPGTARKRDIFCHVLYATDSVREAAPEVQITDGEQVRLSFADAGKEYTISLTKGGAVGGHVRISEGGKVLLDQELTGSIQPQRFEPAAIWSEARGKVDVLSWGDDGIAAKYPGDKGIEKDPAVIFAEGFEGGEIPTVGSGKTGGFYDLRGYPEQMHITGNEAAVGEHSLELVHPKGTVSPQWMHRRFAGENTVYVRFYRKYAQDWAWPPSGAHDTYLFAGRYGSPAATDLTLYLDIPQGPTKWIDKGNWDMSRQPVLTLKSSYQGAGLDFGHGVPIISHVGWDNYYGMPYNIAEAVYMEGGRWYCFEYMAKMNSVSEKGKGDGEIRLWIDGKLTTEMTGLILRNDSHMEIKWDRWMLGPRYGIKKDGSPKTQTSWIDGIVAAKKYIGPSKRKPPR